MAGSARLVATAMATTVWMMTVVAVATTATFSNVCQTDDYAREQLAGILSSIYLSESRSSTVPAPDWATSSNTTSSSRTSSRQPAVNGSDVGGASGNDTPSMVQLAELDAYLLELGNRDEQTEQIEQQQQQQPTSYGSAEAGFIAALNAKVFSRNAPFNPAYSDRVSAECKRQSAHFLRSYRSSQLWAFRMHDASAKLSHGILNGNINQYGDFDQCVRLQEEQQQQQHGGSGPPAIVGRYCMAEVQPTVKPNTVMLQYLFDLVQAHRMLKSNLHDPGHRVPRFSTVHWALCVPAGCTAADVQASLADFLAEYIAGTGIETEVKVNPALCQTRHQLWQDYFTDRTLLVWAGFALYGLLVLGATVYDYRMATGKAEWLTAFSLIKNTRSIVCLKEERNDISCVHGIRFLNAMLLLIAHKSMALFFNPYVNRTEMSEILGQPWTVIGRAAAIFTDPFIMFSGFLTTFSFVERLQRGQRVRLHQEYVGRLLRIMPPLGALILFCTFVLPFLGTGPLWNLVVTNHGTICKRYWWRNMLFIHNYFGFQNMCLTHTHHVGIDTELFLIAPLFIYLVWRWPRPGIAALAAIASLTTVHRFYTTYHLRLANYVYFGTSVKQLFDTADHMYTLPYYRVTVYLMGVILGYVCSKYKTIKLSVRQIKIGWYLSSLSIAVAFFGPAPMGSIHYVYDPMHAASYAAFSPIAWCLFFAWTVFTAHLGYRNMVIDFFSWRGFRVTTRISYAVYLTQFPIFFYNVGRTRAPQYFEFIPAVIFNTNEYLVVFLASFLLTVLFETPFINLKKLLFPSKSRTALQAETIRPLISGACSVR
ncbi:nose resistant to fluoxetine protein 6-like [Anopheles darlingi]|uniref:nose resistant to fluoxetine protein 6-like n=1 Tax=Anopheles darlingi TaxID=43151 RepID=UPI00210060A3|nr:nose resistant to fluoxetine protein 6-like [Anopheles darlingi]